jgi:hypothetical protein
VLGAVVEAWLGSMDGPCRRAWLASEDRAPPDGDALRRAVRAVVTDDYARQHHYANAKNLREQIYTTLRAPEDKLLVNGLFRGELVDTPFDASDGLIGALMACEEELTQPLLRRLVLYCRALSHIIPPETPVQEAFRLFDAAEEAARKSMRVRNSRRRK